MTDSLLDRTYFSQLSPQRTRIKPISLESLGMDSVAINEAVYRATNFSIIASYEVIRVGGGIANPVLMIETANEMYYAIRIYCILIDQSISTLKYLEHNQKELDLLGSYYPKTMIQLLDNGDAITIQEFLPYDSIELNSCNPISVWIEFYAFATKRGVYLDSNLNHFLYDEKTNRIYYVDKEATGEKLELHIALTSNLSQVFLYRTDDTIQHYIDACVQLIKETDPEIQQIGQVFLNKINRLIE